MLPLSDGPATSHRPFIVGIGGTRRPNSSPECATRVALKYAAAAGAETELFDGAALNLPIYDPDVPERDTPAHRLIEAMRRADGFILASPGYHGSISGMLKNALDYAEDLRSDTRPYFDGRSVGMMACAYGWQATGTTLMTLRSITHALRGWPSPMAVAINSSQKVFDAEGAVIDPNLDNQIRILAEQVVNFAKMHRVFSLQQLPTAA
ncbi:NAD(P)H-dependent oxidoreductase [Nevskia sp.]|uniref:NADPH-dependent FMN reductase n=1 Tax=Nevskia sp. TaxID=1929292 RepID=UPI0025E5B956|nr:NAD(P)H-dependent oxidoreductase [Nevskia sp.]